jgi:hypothetical protein
MGKGPSYVKSYKLRTRAGESVKAGGAMDSCSDWLRSRERSSSPSLVRLSAVRLSATCLVSQISERKLALRGASVIMVRMLRP